MKENVLARRYARALFEIARDREILEIIRKEVQFFDENLRANGDFRLFLHSKKISKSEKTRTIEELLQDRVSGVFLNFVLLLLKKNRESLFSTITAEFDKLVDSHHRRVRATAYSAMPLVPDSLGKLKLFLDREFDADVHIKNQTDPSLLGGIIVNVGGQVFNGSLQSQLDRLRAQMVEADPQVSN